MKVTKYEKFNECIYTDELDNGLSIAVIPKKDFHKTFATLSTKYGSINRNIGDKTYPAGIAHFLEHKLFDKKDYDAMDLFSEYGASSNAFTSFNKTSYLFSTTDKVKENLNVLLDFVQDPYFDAEKVEKEKGIIGQEISMYDDDPGAVLYFKTIQNMFPDTPLNVDIAGTADSIDKITVQDLYDSYNHFYQPSNMQLTVVGNVKPEEIYQWIKDNQDKKTFEHRKPVEPYTISSNQINPSVINHMDVIRPKVAIGIKGYSKYNGSLRYELAISLLLELLFTESSPIYEKLYDQGIIDDSFGFDFDCEDQFNFAIIAGETDKAELFVKNIKNILSDFEELLSHSQKEFELIQKEEIGQHISMMNSIETIANNIGSSDHNYANLYDEIEIIQSLTLNDLIDLGKKFINVDNTVVNMILPKNN